MRDFYGIRFIRAAVNASEVSPPNAQVIPGMVQVRQRARSLRYARNTEAVEFSTNAAERDDWSAYDCGYLAICRLGKRRPAEVGGFSSPVHAFVRGAGRILDIGTAAEPPLRVHIGDVWAEDRCAFAGDLESIGDDFWRAVARLDRKRRKRPEKRVR